MTNKHPWALVLGASSGYGEATALELARAGMNIFGVHLDRYDQLQRVGELENKIRALGRQSRFVNGNAAMDDTRRTASRVCNSSLRRRPERCACWCIRSPTTR